jgi:hypothetical protein
MPDPARRLLAYIAAVLNAVAERRLVEAPTTERYQHIKRGTTYAVIGRGKLQTDAPLSDYAELVAYRCEETGDIWFRPVSEFTPDRFRALPAPPEATP